MPDSATKLIENWSRHLSLDRRRSVHTVKAYVTTAERLSEFLAGHFGEAITGDHFKALKQTDLRSYLAHRRGDGLSNNSTARELSAIRGFLRYVGGEDAKIPTLKGPRVKRGVPRPVAPDDVIALAEEVSEGQAEAWVGARDWAVLLLLYGCGLRISEALSITGAHLPLDETLRITGKRDKTRIVPLLPQVREAIERYIELCPYTPEREEPIFRGTRGGPLSPAIIRRSVQGARKRLRLPEQTTPHALRHSFATHLLGGGADLRSLQELLGHASLSSTQVYTEVDAAKMLDIYNNAHPRA